MFIGLNQLCRQIKLTLIIGVLFSAPAFANDITNGTWSTTDGSNTASSPNGWPSGTFPNQVEPISRATMGAIKRTWERGNPTLSTTGSAGAYVITPTNPTYPIAYTQGEVYCAKANFTSVGNDTLNVNGLGAKPLFVQGAASIARIAANAILTGAQFCSAYDGALNSGGGGFQLLSYTFPSITGFLQSSNNLSDVGSAATSRTNLGLANGATTVITESTSGPSGTPAAGSIWIQY